jgi:eukaryotic-like serine/threonine-protein kinase
VDTALLPAAVAGYTDLRPLGDGPHGRCLVARPPQRLGIDGDVVLKVFAAPVGEAAHLRAVEELRAASAVGSPHVVPVLEAVLADRFAHAVPHFPLGPLAAPARRLSPADVLAALEHAARGAHALHEAGIAHGAIHPHNVLLAEQGDGTIGGALVDLGLDAVLTPGVTVPVGAGAGGLEFRDPDLLAGAAPSRRTEVWALGATIHHALTGAGLYGELPAHDPLRAVRAVVLGPRPQLRPDLDPAAAELVRDCTADGAARLRTAADVADRLADLRAR